ncbi:TolC family protein [Marinifilum flexuosum]|uniref:Outer membrane protein TolC n=1 Tax=Marinifilum flexuosum TaxID=1117708 RepID=A0A419XAJ1_9BACT|nr:TolC family protein [Marinifilum flexuosum]RKE04767.1 outer membrane protein TolC [Marinifilum flexuosum]
MRYAITIFLIIWIGANTFAQVNNPELKVYINIAENNNPELKAMDLKYQQALEKVPQVKSLPDPTFSAGVFIQPIETRVGAQKAKLSVSQMFPWFGTLGAKEQQASLQAHAIYLRYLDARSKLQMNVTTSWLDIVLTDQKIFFTQKRIEVLDLLEKQSLKRYESDQTDMVNVLYIQMLKEELISKLELFKDKRNTQKTGFNKLLNRDLSTDVNTPEDNSFLLISSIANKDIEFTKHYRVASWDQMVESAQYGEKASKLNALPKFGVGLDYAILSKRTDMNVADNGQDAIMPMLSVSIPIFRKKYKAAIKVNEFKQQEYEELKTAEMNQLELELQQALELYKIGIRNTDLYQNLIAKAKQSYEILSSSYESSTKRYEEVLNMQQKIWIYEQKQIEAQIQVQKSLAHFKYLEADSYGATTKNLDNK